MRSELRAAGLVLRLTFQADPWRAAWLALRSPINMGTVLGTAYGLKLITDSALARDVSGVAWAAALLAVVQLLGSVAGEGSLSARAAVIEKTSLLVDRRLMAAALDVPGIEHHEIPTHRDQLELLRLRRGELGELVDTISHNVGMLILSVGSVVLLAQIHPLLLLLPAFGIPSLLASTHAERLRVKAQEASAETLRSTRHLFEVATQSATGKEVRVFGLGPSLGDRHRLLWKEANRLQDRAVWIGSLLSATGWLLFSAAYVASVGFVLWLAVHDRATVGDAVMALKLAADVNELVTWMVFMSGWLVGQLSTAGRVSWLIDYARSRAFAHPERAAAPDRLRHGISLEDVTFRYPDTDRAVIRQVSLDIPAGSTVAVVGENGAGKSTLVKLLARFYDPTAGRILVDGTDLQRIDPVEWRSRLAAGFQDFLRLELRAGETVGVGDLPHVEDEPAITEALTRAAATDVVDALPDGLRTPLGTTFDEGAELSGGQWQKLALGRAMMRPGPLLLLLDEPTASLDAMTEHTLFDRYAANARRLSRETGAVTVLISHRFSTVRMADLIVVLQAGEVVEYGSHDELMAHNGRYAELFTLQARAYR